MSNRALSFRSFQSVLAGAIALLCVLSGASLRAETPIDGAKRQMQNMRIVSITVTPNRLPVGSREEVEVVVKISDGAGRTGVVTVSHDASPFLAEIYGLPPLHFDGKETELQCNPAITTKQRGKIRLKASLSNSSTPDSEKTAVIEIY